MSESNTSANMRQLTQDLNRAPQHWKNFTESIGIMSRIDSSEVKRLLEQLELVPEKLMKDAESEFRKNTPVQSGNARSKTRLKNKTTILADYGYAHRLNTGWSNQAPGGMTDPTIDYMERQVDRLLGRID